MSSVLIVELGPPLLTRLRGAAIRSPEAGPATSAAKRELARTLD
jgi:hypothetical protein